MKCSNCGFENESGKKFCTECGAKLTLKCPQCGADVKPAEKFCGECGHELKAGLETSTVDYSQPESYTPRFLADKILTTRSSIEGERKLVTVFFADVAGYTTLSEKLDPEEVHQIMDGCFKILMDEIHRFEGTINQFTGDGVMALFGAPLAHEDHAQRACHAALSVQKALGEYGDKVKADTGLEYKMRIGLNSGHVIVGSIGDDLRMDYTAVGDTTNLADRMQGLAEPGTVMVSTNTHRLASNYFDFDSLGKVEVKGKEEKQDVYKLIKTGEIDTRIGASVSKGLTRFVGRKISMAALEEPYDRVVEGSGQVTGIVGEAGVGKSRILLEFINQLPQGEFTYLEGRCLHYGGSMAYLPVIDILKTYFEVKDADREFIIKKKIEEKVIDLDLNLEQTLPSFQEILSLKVDDETYLKQDAQMKKILTFEALRDLFIRISENQPLVIAIEDLHWIDKISEDFIDYLIGWLANSKIYLLLLYRPEYTHQWGSKSYYSKIGLDQLPLDSAKELVTAMLEGGEVAPELRELILSRSAGNPLFMEEFTQTLLENGSIKKLDNRFGLDRDINDIQVPDTIQGIISARMDRLEDNLKRTMQVASVIGRDFALRILQSITGMKEELKSYLLSLQGLEFIYEKKLFPELEYIFKHALIQEVAYNSLLQQRRKEIHKKIANAIEVIYSDRLDEFYKMLFYHYSKAESQEKAIEFGKKAAEHSLSVFAPDEAISILERTISLVESESSKELGMLIDLRLLLCDALISAGQPQTVLDKEVNEIFTFSETLNDRQRAFRSCKTALWALFHKYVGPAFRTPDAGMWAERAIKYSDPGSKDRIVAESFLGATFMMINPNDGVQLIRNSLLKAQKHEDPELLGLTKAFCLFSCWTNKYADEELDLAREMLQKPITGLNPLLYQFFIATSLTRIFSHGDVDTGLKSDHQLHGLYERTRLPYIRISALAGDAVRSLVEGNLEETIEIANEIESFGNERDLADYAKIYVFAIRPRAELLLGREPIGLTTENKPDVISPWAVEVALENPKLSMKRWLSSLARIRPTIGTSEDMAATWQDVLLLDTAVSAGDHQVINLLINQLSECKIKVTGIWCTTSTSLVLGNALVFLGRFEEARIHYLKAVDDCTEMPFRPELALSRFQLAELQFEHFPEERTEAMEHLEFAISEFEEMKMKPSLEKAMKLKESLEAD